MLWCSVGKYLQQGCGSEELQWQTGDGGRASQRRQNARRRRLELVRDVHVPERVLRVDIVHTKPLETRDALALGESDPHLLVDVAL